MSKAFGSVLAILGGMFSLNAAMLAAEIPVEACVMLLIGVCMIGAGIVLMEARGRLER